MAEPAPTLAKDLTHASVHQALWVPIAKLKLKTAA